MDGARVQPHERRHRRWSTLALAAGALLAAGLATTSCSGGDDGGSGDDDSLDEGVTELGGDTGDGGTDAVTGDIEALLDDYNRTVNEIIADPSVVEDPDDPIVRDYLGLFEPDSQLAADALGSWAQQAAEGVSIRPVNDDHPALVSRLDGDVELTGDDEARFPTCDEHRYLVYNAEGGVDDLVESTVQHGEGVAVRVDGDWRLRDLRNIADGQGCQTQSEG